MSEIANLINNYDLASKKFRYSESQDYFEKKCKAYEEIIVAFASLEAENAALKERMRWVPVGERLPKEKQSVLALDRSGTAYHWEFSRSLSNIFVSDYTHWMPLPEAPEVDAQ